MRSRSLGRVARFAAVGLILALAAGCGGGGGSAGPTPSPTSGLPSICSNPGDDQLLGTVQAPELIEISGLAASRNNQSIVWAHNDSGDSARIFAMTTRGEHRGVFTLAGAEAIDWEDMAIGPGPVQSQDYLYLADIGDNMAQRPEVVVYRAAEPRVDAAAAPVTQELSRVDRLAFRYPDRPHDAETLLADPLSGDLFIVTKESPALVFRASPVGQETTVLEQVAQIDFAGLPRSRPVPPDAPPLVQGAGQLATGGDISQQGHLIAIRTYATVWVWSRAEGDDVARALSAAPCEGPSAIEAQGEALAFDAPGVGYITVSEGMNPPLHYFFGR